MPLDPPVYVDIEDDRGNISTVTLRGTDPGMLTSGTAVWGPYPCGQQGRLIGFTLRTMTPSGNVVSLQARLQDFVEN